MPDPTLADLDARITRVEQRIGLTTGTLTSDPAPAPALQPPGAPGAPRVVEQSATQLVLAAEPGAGAAADRWELRDDLDAQSPVKATTAPPWVRSPMRPDSRARRYRARAGNRAGWSGWSAPLDVPAPAAAPAPSPTPTPSTPPPGGIVHPSDVLDLRRWTIMRPTGTQGSPDNGYLLGKSIPDVFFVRADRGVVFRAAAGGVHSKGSKFCRCEARQAADEHGALAAWPSTEAHSLECDLAIDTRGLKARRRVVGMQIHDAADDVCQIMRHETLGLGFMHNDGRSWVSIDPGYVDGTRFTCRITVVPPPKDSTAPSRLQVLYNGRQVVDVEKTGVDWYWKFGCYLQTNVPNYHEDPAATGEVVVWRYQLDGA